MEMRGLENLNHFPETYQDFGADGLMIKTASYTELMKQMFIFLHADIIMVIDRKDHITYKDLRITFMLQVLFCLSGKFFIVILLRPTKVCEGSNLIIKWGGFLKIKIPPFRGFHSPL